MSEREGTVHPFTCYVVEDGVKGTEVGASYDNASAVTIACAVWAAMQGSNPKSDLVVEVFDSTDAQIAVIGRAWGPA